LQQKEKFSLINFFTISAIKNSRRSISSSDSRNAFRHLLQGPPAKRKFPSITHNLKKRFGKPERFFMPNLIHIEILSPVKKLYFSSNTKNRHLSLNPRTNDNLSANLSHTRQFPLRCYEQAMKTLVATLALSTLLVSLLFAQERDRRSDPKKEAQPKIEKANWDRIKERIEGAVERGEMTREQADQKYKELKKSLEAKSQGNRNQPKRARPGSSPQMPRQRRPDALGQLVGKLVAQKKINREDARRIIETASASRPPMQNRPNTHGQISGELRDILDQARNELAELQEAREEMHREHEEWERHRDEHAEHEEWERHRDEHAEHEEWERHRDEHAEHEEREHHSDEHAEHDEREHHSDEHAERDEREHHSDEHAEHDEREHHSDEHAERD
jgi:hypothetical protein